MSYPLIRMIPRPRFLLSMLLASALLGLSGCRDATPVVTNRFSAFGTAIDLSLVGVGLQQAVSMTGVIEQDFIQLQHDWDPWLPGPMARVNRLLPTGERFVAPPSIAPLVRISQDLERRSAGLFNPATGYLLELWGFRTNRPSSHPPPPARQIDALISAAPSMNDLTIDGLEFSGANPALKLDFTAIALPYALDLAIEQLHAQGVRSAFIQAGRFQRAIGDRSGQPWRIPLMRANGARVLGILLANDGEGVATVTEYDRNFVFNGRFYHAVLDPRTGRPASGVRAVTVVHDDLTTAAAAAQALFIAGLDHWHALARQLGVRYVMLVDSQGVVHINPELHERLVRVDDHAPIVRSPPLDDPAS